MLLRITYCICTYMLLRLKSRTDRHVWLHGPQGFNMIGVIEEDVLQGLE